MQEQVTSFILKITGISPGLKDEYNKISAYWAPDQPPVTTALGQLGDRIVDDLDIIDLVANEAIFAEIEKVMVGDDIELKTAVATGMIEGIVGRASRGGTWDRIRPILGKASASYADAWASD